MPDILPTGNPDTENMIINGDAFLAAGLKIIPEPRPKTRKDGRRKNEGNSDLRLSGKGQETYPTLV
jgi:hypothetical protein